MSRREKIEAMLSETPEDTFLKYALALEWDKENEHEKSLTLFQDLMNAQPAYVPAFFMAGQMLARIDRENDARPIIEQGIKEARQQGNDHAAGEMTQFLEMLNG